ncbi:probable xyloglucan endotransglucosylase/hydrolase protein 26 [Nymphaea colorata]|nr:probable xyloglucan endotransglucosylase/hydrolase protein 26 [Nymphaea colorata]
MGSVQLLFAGFIILISLTPNSVEANFYQSTVPVWGQDRAVIYNNGWDLELWMDQSSGSGIKSKREFLFGSLEMHIKLVSGNSAGTVTAYYLTSFGDAHDEIDFEFLGNVSGQPYTIHTNIFIQGVGAKEQQFKPWFDPSADFHNYTIHWNPYQIVWFIDGIPIRVYENHENAGIPFPNKQGMRMYTSLWNGDNWATQGGKMKVDWSSAPFVARFSRFSPKACKWQGPRSISECSSPSLRNWWTRPSLQRLSYAQLGQLRWVRENFMIYDYCRNPKRFHGNPPPECYRSRLV